MRKVPWTLALLALSSCVSASRSAEVASVTPSPSSTEKKEERVWVTRPDGSKQCEPNSQGVSVDEMSKELRAAGIEVYETRKGTDGKKRIMMCGAPTGRLNGFLISQGELNRALEAGFQPAPKGFADSLN